MKSNTVRRAIASALILLVVSFAGLAQEKADDTPAKRKGAIKGKVTSEDGQPIEGATVGLGATGVFDMGSWRQIQTDEEGNFVADGLAPALYSVNAGSSGYVMPDTPLESKYYRLGEVVNFTLIKGGVITGRVTNALGEPVIAVPIRAERIADAEGRKTAVQSWYGQQRKTDDRGIYRVYGLPAGKYIVSVGGTTGYRSDSSKTYESDTPTYYPSSTRDAATEVTVNSGDEVRGIDIRYRPEKGHSISGKVTGAPLDTSLLTGGIQVDLYHFPSRAIAQSTYIQATDAGKSFEFFTVPDGEYELRAFARGDWQDDTKDAYQSQRKRVTIKGGNLTGIELRLLMLASVQAKIEWGVTPEKERKAECQGASLPLLTETLIRLVKDDPALSQELNPDSGLGTLVPNEKNEIKFKGLEASNYRFSASPLNEAWYIKAITAKPLSLSSQISNRTSQIDIGKQGLSLKSGEKRTDVVITMADGAASLSGCVTVEKNHALPSPLRVHLVPAEKEAAEDLLRYAEQKTKDGTFSFTNLAPGRYWLLVRKVPDDESDTKRVNPVVWDISTRKALRAEAEAANIVVDLARCQKVNVFTLKFTTRK